MGYDPRIVLEPTITVAGPALWIATLIVLGAAWWLARRRPDWGLAAVVAALPLYQVRGEILGLPTTLLELLLGAVLLGILTRRPRERFRRTPYDPWAGLFVLGSLAAVLLGPDLREGFGLWRAFVLEPVAFFYACTAVFRRRDPRPLLAGTLGSLVVLIGWTGYLLGDGRGLTYDDRLLGPFQTANYFALLLVPILLVTVLWPRRDLLWLRVPLAATGLVMLAAANSRGGQLALVAGSAAAVPFLGRRLRFVLFGCLAAALVLAGALLGPRLVKHTEAQVVSARPVIWREAATFIREDPLRGSSPGQFQDRFRERVAANQDETLYVAPQALNAHNLFLVAWTEWGLVTVVALGGLLVTLVRVVLRRRSFWMVLPAALGAAIVVHGMVDTSVFKNDLAVVFWLTLALSVTLPSVRKRRVDV